MDNRHGPKDKESMMRVTITIDDNALYINGKLAQRVDIGEQITIDGGKSEYRIIVYRKINKDKKIIKLADRKEDSRE